MRGAEVLPPRLSVEFLITLVVVKGVFAAVCTLIFENNSPWRLFATGSRPVCIRRHNSFVLSPGIYALVVDIRLVQMSGNNARSPDRILNGLSCALSTRLRFHLNRPWQIAVQSGREGSKLCHSTVATIGPANSQFATKESLSSEGGFEYHQCARKSWHFLSGGKKHEGVLGHLGMIKDSSFD